MILSITIQGYRHNIPDNINGSGLIVVYFSPGSRFKLFSEIHDSGTDRAAEPGEVSSLFNDLSLRLRSGQDCLSIINIGFSCTGGATKQNTRN